MAARTTRTLNPLHFEDLEPHRFEDLIRQLAYDFRPWKRLEPTGRLGADDGIDIQGVEAVSVEVSVDGEAEEEERPGTIERLWTIQCKREKSIHPADIRAIIAEAIPDGTDVPYGFIVSAACDFSKRSRDTFIIELRDRGVQEFHLWGKADLEDMLFQPKNDHLLFAYFGISLQVRRRTMKSEIRSRLATKKSLNSVLGEKDPQRFIPVLVRDATAQPPSSPDSIDFLIEQRSFVFCNCIGDTKPDHLSFVVRRHLAFVEDQRSGWDAMLGVPDNQAYNTLMMPFLRNRNPTRGSYGEWDAFKAIDPKNQAWYNVIAYIHLNRIIAIDPHGDAWIEGPHLYVEPHPVSGVFEPDFDRSVCRYPSGPWLARPDPGRRVEKFSPELRGTSRYPNPSGGDPSTATIDPPSE